MKPPILLVHPERYQQLVASFDGKACSTIGIDYRQLAGIEVRQSSYVPLTTTAKQRRPWWEFGEL